MRSAIGFALAVTAVMLLATLAHRHYGQAGLLIATAAAGLADAHAPAASIAAVHGAGNLDDREAAAAILFALTTNSITKVVLAFSAGPRPFAARVGLGVLLVAAAAWAGWLAFG
jgi:uncharacterized membrane protein (DUF4010 family)